MVATNWIPWLLLDATQNKQLGQIDDDRIEVYHFYRYLTLRNAFLFASCFNNIKQRMVIYHKQMSIVWNLRCRPADMRHAIGSTQIILFVCKETKQ